MNTYLDGILERKREDLVARKRSVTLADLKSRAASTPPPLDFTAALGAPGMQIIAEIKKASPSRGVMAADLDPIATAETYARNGAAAISVLTEEPHFHGNLDLLAAIKAGGCEDGPPLLRKDFILEPYQVYESRAYRADALLLIVAALTDTELQELLSLAHELGLQCLVEAHTVEEAKTAVAAGARVIGINNRDLHTFETHLETTAAVRPSIPDGCLVVSESGIRSRADVELIGSWGVDAVLIGEALVTSAEPGAKLREFLGA